MALDHPSFGFRCHDFTLELWLCSFLLFVFWRLDFDSELMLAKGVPRMTHTTFETFNVSALLVTIQAVLSLFASRLTMSFELGFAPEEHPVLFANVLWGPKTYRERMTQDMFETINVPVTFVTIQAVSVHFETHDGHRVGH